MKVQMGTNVFSHYGNLAELVRSSCFIECNALVMGLIFAKSS